MDPVVRNCIGRVEGLRLCGLVCVSCQCDRVVVWWCGEQVVENWVSTYLSVMLRKLTICILQEKYLLLM